ncbi:hypothetical protein L2E82_47108 [Cichorium intybus]|uniref:Uncharacterized protein n=1 Tax=Cichorium intybus TaxID=13427 RepID=A0ACB8YUV2_CICIN|nr:hypothetical protein L2E82_47108 [Cichorium intybus]
MMPNSKNNSSDPQNSTDLKTNDSASKNHAADPKNNNADQKNNTSAPKYNADLTKSISTSRKNNIEWKNRIDSITNVDAPPPQGDGGGGNLPPPSGASQSSESQSPRNGNKPSVHINSKTSGICNQYFAGLQEWTTVSVIKRNWLDLMEEKVVYTHRNLIGLLPKRSICFLIQNASSEKGGESNLTLGGIDLNSSGSVVVKADKKLLTVLFPDGRDGRSFTLKAETLEDLHEWKTSLEEALANAPTAGTGMGQNGITKNEKGENTDGSHEQSKDRSPPKSAVLGRPVLLALEDIDGTPSFLEKALRYVEEHGIKVEGILRQAADVELVERRIQEYEQGKTEFTADEDGHVIGDCIKFVLRELPSSPVPASCCKALLQAYRTDRANRVSHMRAAICDTFPEPNRRLLQRILITMEAVAENKEVNRMSVPAVAACMSPLLLRPLLAGEVELDNEFNMGGDGSAQLMQAAAAANHAQAIIITLLEEYDNIFGEGDMLSDLYSDSDESGSESEELSDENDYEDGDYSSEGSRTDEDSEHASSSCSESGDRDKKAKKKTAIDDNIDVIAEESDEIVRLEALKADLMKKVEAETKHNSVLKEELVSKKDALGERHQALKQEVATLKQQLQRERELRKVLEAGLTMSKKILPLPNSIDEKTKADLEEIAHAENEVIGLQQKLDDLEIQLHSGQNQGKVKDKEKKRDISCPSRKNKDKQASKEHHGKLPFHSFSSKFNPTQQSESTRKGGPSMTKSNSVTVKRSESRGEAANNTNSALSKITNRLNFLKEKRSQMTNELETVDKDKDKEPNKSLDIESDNQSSIDNNQSHTDNKL